MPFSGFSSVLILELFFLNAQGQSADLTTINNLILMKVNANIIYILYNILY